MLPFPPFDSSAIATEVDAVSGWDKLRHSVQLGLLQSDDVTALCGSGSQEGVDVADAVDAFDSCCANIKSAERELFQPRPALATWCFMWAAFLIASSSIAFPDRVPSAVRSVPGFYLGSRLGSSDVVGAALPPRLDSSIAESFAY